eukprot:7595441-Pyramimonas_sp.AAC.2
MASYGLNGQFYSVHVELFGLVSLVQDTPRPSTHPRRCRRAVFGVTKGRKIHHDRRLTHGAAGADSAHAQNNLLRLVGHVIRATV